MKIMWTLAKYFKTKFSCNQCQKTFSFKVNLKNHLRTKTKKEKITATNAIKRFQKQVTSTNTKRNIYLLTLFYKLCSPHFYFYVSHHPLQSLLVIFHLVNSILGHCWFIFHKNSTVSHNLSTFHLQPPHTHIIIHLESQLT